MLKLYTIAIIGAQLNQANALGDNYDYKLQGKDWKFNPAWQCDGDNQSPINLISRQSTFAPTVLDGRNDYTMWNYSNQERVVAKYTGLTTSVTLQTPNTNYFKSAIASRYFDMQEQYFAKEFHFHAPSEHKIDGRRFDFEMNTIHLPDPAKQKEDPESTSAVIGILFSVENSNVVLTNSQIQIIDEFFDSLYLNQKSDPLLNSALYGELMNLVDLKNRWVYKGSLTAPPCTVGVYYNILSNVYPIKEKHLNQFKAQLERNKDYVAPSTLAVVGNYRELQETTPLHYVHFISNFNKETDYSQDVDFWTGNGILLFTLLIQISTKAAVGVFNILNPVYSAFPFTGLNVETYMNPNTGETELYT